jgi:hypothetical protein
MGAQRKAKIAPELHEGSWAYLSLSAVEGQIEDRRLFRDVMDACESSGWPAVSWSPAPRADGDASDFERFVDGMSHAIAHADVVVIFIDGPSDLVDMELEFAYEHRRPIIALRCSGDRTPGSDARQRLGGYDRVRLIEWEDPGRCVAGLREVLNDAGFGAIVGEAGGEPSRHV